ncbi:hypothetical protein [Streptomyces albogriseolus]|uniref:hypothetical protein n=1 Tax=Streptomyces albogriseolus TaxID=1887 RepID=UPI0033B9E1B8
MPWKWEGDERATPTGIRRPPQLLREALTEHGPLLRSSAVRRHPARLTVRRAWGAGERPRLKVWPGRAYTFDSPTQDETYAWLDPVLRA